jgi:hypothetical protein
MNENSFRRFRCWSAERVQRTVFDDIASLGLDADAVFLAAHTSLQIEHFKGIQQSGADREVGVLRALDSEFGLPDVNTLIAVTGPSGSGKSHLVRWVRANLSAGAETYHLIYVPREIATLRDLLGHVLDRMPGPESDAVLAELDKAVGQKRPEQLAEELLDKVRSVLSYELPEAKGGQDPETRRYLLGTVLEDGGGRDGGLADLLLVKPIRDHMLRPEGAIRRMIDSVRGQRRGGDEETPEFNAAEWPTKQAGIASQLEKRLQQLWSFVRKDPDSAAQLLNEARNRAIAEALGMRPGVNLGEVFSKTRRRLRGLGQDLVLLFEDLAQFGLFDGELFNQLGLQPGEDLAPIRAVFAITDGKFEDVPDTVRTRLAHQFKVRELIGADGEQSDNIIEFVSRYLNIARVGRDRLIESAGKAAPEERESGAWIPNACLDRGDGRECINREECWDSFGVVKEVGLYPYNRTALRRSFSKKGSRVTARMLVGEVVRDFLVEADSGIDAGVFPSKATSDRFDFTVSLPKEVIVPADSLDEAQRDRLHRCRVIWADGSVESTAITVAFDLPSVEGKKRGPAPDKPVASVHTRPEPLVPLFDWENDVEMLESEATWYREKLYDLVLRRLDLSSMLIDQASGLAQVLLGRILSGNSFELKHAPGQRAGQNRLKFPIEDDAAGVLLLSAVRWWWDHGHWNIGAEDRKWDFPLDPVNAQLSLDEFLDDAVRKTEDLILAILSRGPLDPASAAIALRASALLALGHKADHTRGPSLEWVFATPSARSIAPSPAWAAVSTESLLTMNDVDARWVSAFASAKQGDTGDSLGVDAARLIPIAMAAASDPLAALAGEASFDDAFSEISQHWEALQTVLRAGVDAEARSLVEILETIRDQLSGSQFDELVGAIASAGRLAGDNNVFRPHEHYRSFLQACDRLGQVSHDQLASWIATSAALMDTAGVPSLTEVMGAQGWAPQARSVQDDLKLAQSCLETTTVELSDRLIEDLGETPDAAAARISAKVARVSEAVTAIFKSDEGVGE